MSDTPRTDAKTFDPYPWNNNRPGRSHQPQVMYPCDDGSWVDADHARELERELAAITGEEGELWELRQENARLKDNLASLSKLHAKEAEKWRMSSVCRELRAELDATKQELEQARQDAKQSDLDGIRALGERNDARKELAAERELADRLAEVIDGLDWITDPPQALAAYKTARNKSHE